MTIFLSNSFIFNHALPTHDLIISARNNDMHFKITTSVLYDFQSKRSIKITRYIGKERRVCLELWLKTGLS